MNCFTLVYKEAGEDGRTCPEEATCVACITGEDGEIVEAVPLCQRHFDRLSTGHTLMVRYSAGDVVLLRC